MHPRVSCPGHLCGRRCPGTVEELRRAQQNEIKDTAYPHGKKRAAGKKVVLITMADQRQVLKEAASTENTLDSALRPLQAPPNPAGKIYPEEKKAEDGGRRR